jgi:carbamate kinase
MTDLLRPLSEYVVPGDTTTVQLTLELVEAIKERRETRRREAILDHTTRKGSSSSPKMAKYQVESFNDPIGESNGPQLGTLEAQRSPTSTQAALESSRLAQLVGGSQSASGNLFFLEKDDDI